MTERGRIKRDMPQLYNSWRGMRDRCRSMTRADAHCYAAKGIAICREWDSVVAFKDWALENGYEPGLTIDREDGSKGYCPENCRWVDRLVQARNISRNRIVEFNGESHCVSEWAEITGIRSANIHARLRLGWSIHAALTTPNGAIPSGPKPGGKRP